MILYTIGHSNHKFEEFVKLLIDKQITVLVDVRTTPYSRYNLQFNREELERKLPQRKIQYIFKGKYLGGRPSDPTCYRNQKLPAEGSDYLYEVDYTEIMKREWFVKAIEELLEISSAQTTAIMCSEEDPAKCHRHHLITKYIMDNYPEIDVRHIRGNKDVYGASQVTKSLHNDEAEQLPLF